MTREEYLLILLAEECAEVAQRATKVLRFGMTDPAGSEPGQPYNNRERLLGEVNDLLTILGMIFPDEEYVDKQYQYEKRMRIEKYLRLSQELGTVDKS